MSDYHEYVTGNFYDTVKERIESYKNLDDIFGTIGSEEREVPGYYLNEVSVLCYAKKGDTHFCWKFLWSNGNGPRRKTFEVFFLIEISTKLSKSSVVQNALLFKVMKSTMLKSLEESKNANRPLQNCSND